MRLKVAAWVVAVGIFCLCGVTAQAFTSTQSLSEDIKPSIEESTPGLPLRKDSVIPQGTLIRVSVAIVIGLVLAIVGAYLLKRYLFARNPLSSSDQSIQLLEVKRLSPRLILFRVRVDDKTIVLAQSGEQLIELDPDKTFETRQEANDDEV